MNIRNRSIAPVLDADLRVSGVDGVAPVMQDEFANTYQEASK